MARSATTKNDFDPRIVRDILGKIDGFECDYASAKAQFKESITNVLKEAAETHGIPTNVLCSLVKIRRNESQNRQIYDELDSDEQITLSMLALAEGVPGLPQWRAASGNILEEGNSATVQ